MNNIKITIQYDGTDFYGWQIQPNLRTVQGEIYKAVEKIYGEKISNQRRRPGKRAKRSGAI